MRLKKLNFSKTECAIIILILLSGFFIMHKVSWAKDGDIMVTEIMYDVDGSDSDREWFELYNSGSENIDLAGWKVFDKSNHLLKLFSEDNYLINSGEYLIIAKNGIKFKEDYRLNKKNEFEGKIIESSIDLSNTSGKIKLIHGGVDVFEIIYSNDMGGAGNDFSIEVGKEGLLRESVNKWGSPGEKNPEKESEEDFEDSDGGEKYFDNIRINEFLPNPVGSDNIGEYIELYNSGEKDIDLSEKSGWIIEDRVGDKKENLADNKYNKLYFSKYPKDKIIKAGEFLLVKRESGFSFSLSRDDEIILRNSDGAEVDKIEYEGAREGISYNYCEKTNKWRWSEFLTPGAKNEFKEIGEIEIKIDDDIYKDIYAIFEVSMAGVKDRDLKVKWEFGDGKNSYKAKTKHRYPKNGKYVVKLTVSGSSEDIKKEFNIKVEDFPERKVSVVSINPNPKGKDTKEEWIELKNKSKKKVNLKNWSIATGGSKKKLVNHPIYEDFIIKVGKVKQLTREFSKFSLGNKKGYVELRYPNGEVAYKLKYKKEDGIGENEIFRKKEGGGWEWLESEKISTNDNDSNDDEQEDSSVNKIIETEKMKKEEIKDVDLIRDMTPEDFGKYSEKERANLVESYLREELASLQEKSENTSGFQGQVLGVWDNKIKKIRTEDAYYYFNPKSKEEKHYLVKFWEDAMGII